MEATEERPGGIINIKRQIILESPTMWKIMEFMYWWLGRKMTKHGYSPDDAKWLL